jgi:hypothetical protein
MVNSFGPGNQKKPPKPANSKGVKKNINPVATNTPMGGTPAANPMGGAQMDFDMPDMSGMGGMQMNTPEMDFGMGDMGGMQMNAPSPVVGNYEDFMMGMTAIDGKQPSGFQGKMNPGVLEGPTTAGGGIPGGLGMNSMGAQSPQVAGWDDPAMGGFQMDTPMMNDPMMGGMQMGQPDMGAPMMGQFAQPPQVQAPLSPQADLPVAPVAPVVDSLPPVSQLAPPVSQAPAILPPAVSEVAPSVSEAPVVEPAVAPTVSRPPTGQPDWKGDDTPEPGIDPRYVSKSDRTRTTGRNYGTDPDPRAVGPPMVTPKDKPALDEFKDKVDAGEVSDERPKEKKPPHKTGEFPHVGNMESGLVEDYYNEHGKMPVPFDDTPEPVKPFAGVGDASYGKADTGSDSKEDVLKPENWDTSGGQYTYKGAEFGKSNTNPPADTEDWEDTRQEAAAGAGDAIGTASSASRSAANEAAEPAGRGAERPKPKAPLVSLPPTQPQTDKEYYDKLVNPDKFQNPIIPDLPKGYGSQRVEGGGEYYEFPGREYDVKPEEIFDEYGEPLMGSQGIDSNAGGLTVADVRRRGTSPAQIQALVNNAVAQSYGNYNQGVGGTAVSAGQGMDADMGTYAQQKIAPLVAQRMASGQAQVDIPWQYAMQHADSVRQRRDLAHKIGIDEANMIVGDYGDYLGDRMGYADTDNQIMRQFYGEMPDAFG